LTFPSRWFGDEEESLFVHFHLGFSRLCFEGWRPLLGHAFGLKDKPMRALVDDCCSETFDALELRASPRLHHHSLPKHLNRLSHLLKGRESYSLFNYDGAYEFKHQILVDARANKSKE
jgi:hypothetical protein